MILSLILAIYFKSGDEVFDVDEHPREATLEAMAKLPPVFKKNGTVNAGNASVSNWLYSVFFF